MALKSHPRLISNVTEAVVKEVKQWQGRPLDSVYPVVYLDCIRVKVRDAGAVRAKAVYPSEIRRIIYTTNAIESVNMSLRKVTKSRGAFPNDEAVMKLLYLALMNISKRWTMPLREWKPALNRFSIQFEERMPQQ